MQSAVVYDESDFFDEDAISEGEAWDACERFVAYRAGEGVAFKLYDGRDTGRLISKAEIRHFLEQRLDDGSQILLESEDEPAVMERYRRLDTSVWPSAAEALHFLDQRLEDGAQILIA